MDNLDEIIKELGHLTDNPSEATRVLSENGHTLGDVQEKYPNSLPLLPLRNTLLFPGVIAPINIGREKSLRLLQDVWDTDKLVAVVAQRDAGIDEPNKDDIFSIGVTGKILKQIRMHDDSITIIVQGLKKFQIEEITQFDPYYKVKVQYLEEKPAGAELTLEQDALFKSVKDIATQVLQESQMQQHEPTFNFKNLNNPNLLVSIAAINVNAKIQDKQTALEFNIFEDRARKVIEMLTQELHILELKNDIQNKVRGDLDKQQREYFLQQQIKTIQDELGDNPIERDQEKLRAKAAKKKWSKKAKEVFQKEFEKMSRMHPQMAEYSVQMNYLEWLLDLPWAAMAKDNFDLKHAQEILDRDHYGLEKIKERVVEHLAVLKLKKDMKAPILCFYGPPGVGKTSLGKSVAESLGRPYVRIALGGMRDEAEIRGHRRTYIGAMPGRIIQALKKAGKSNPVVVLDEIDKVGREGYGDPSAALLEVLDPEQNNAFVDNYLEVEYDLSQVLFIATANSLSSVHNALLDRMEIVEVTGYSTEEKIKIAQKHLVPKSISEHGISEKQMHIQDDVLEIVIEEYTRESGVRNLRQKIDKLSRQRAKQVALSETFNVTYSAEEVRRILGVSHPKEKYADNTHAGVVTGLAWTSVGGDILFIETSLTRGKGRLSLTGNLGDVMKESATLAMQYLKANPELLHLDYRIFDQWDVHLHFPEGATPKDGPSAGITILTALASAFTQRKVAPLLAMTGEITLRGKVLPVGGIKEKLLAAKRAGIKQIIMSQENQKDVADIQQEFLQGLNIHYVENMSQVLEKALMQEQVEQPKNINYVEEKPTTHAN